MDEQVKNQCRSKLLKIQCVNRFEPLVSELREGLFGDEHTNSGLDVQLVGDRVRALWEIEGSFMEFFRVR